MEYYPFIEDKFVACIHMYPHFLLSQQISEAVKRMIRLSKETYVGIQSASSSLDMLSLSQLAENVTVTTLSTLNTTSTVAPSNLSDPSDSDEDSPLIKFRALQYALFSTCFIEVLGSAFFMLTAMYIVRDKQRVERAIVGE